MIGMVFGSEGTPLWPWHVAHFCAFAAMSSAAYAGTAVTAKATPAPKIIEKRRVNIATFLPPVTADGAGNAIILTEPDTPGSRDQPCKYRVRAHGLGLFYHPSGCTIPNSFEFGQ